MKAIRGAILMGPHHKSWEQASDYIDERVWNLIQNDVCLRLTRGKKLDLIERIEWKVRNRLTGANEKYGAY